MLFAGWATRFLTLDFLTLDFLGPIFFWYFSLRKIFRRKQKFCSIQMCSISCLCSWRPWRLKCKIWRPSRRSLHPCFGLIVCVSVMFLKTLKTFLFFYNNIDKERIKKHFCSSGSSVDTQGYTKANRMTTEEVFLESSEIFRESACRGIGGNVAKKLKRKRYFLWFFESIYCFTFLCNFFDLYAFTFTTFTNKTITSSYWSHTIIPHSNDHTKIIPKSIELRNIYICFYIYIPFLRLS